MRRFIKTVLFIAALLPMLILCGFLYVWGAEYRPEPIEALLSASTEKATIPDTLTIVSWNTGYAGLGADMDFFYEGGTRTRTSEERTRENLEAIKSFLRSCGADIILLQEVDTLSRRSYGINQFEAYRSALGGYTGYFSLNYKTPFVPLPLTAPMGRVEAGLAIFSKTEPLSVIRHGYPGEVSFPVRLFELKRCLMTAEFRTASGKRLLVGNTHNTAYDDGSIRKGEMEFLRDYMTRENRQGKLSIVGGDFNQNPPGYSPRKEEHADPDFRLFSIDPQMWPEGWEFRFDDSVPTMRFLNEPFSSATTVSVIDFFITSPRVRCLGIETVNLGFENSDHNPVRITVTTGN